MKIAIVTATYPPEINGVAMTFGNLAQALSRHGHSITIYRPHRRELRELSRTSNVAEILFPGFPIPGYPLLRFGLPATRRLTRLWRANPPDLVHVVTEGPLGASAVTAARKLGLPVTSSFHTNFHAYARHYGFGLLHQATLAWLRWVHNRTLRTFAPTQQLCGELAAMGFQNLRLVSRGVDLVHFSPDRRSAELRASWGAGPDEVVVVHVGRMAPEKNYGLLLRAFAEMRRTHAKVKCVLAGEGPLKSKLAASHPEHVFAGFFSREEIGRYYASADIYIHASLTETFGNVLTEAMASGLAVAGFNYAAAAQFVVHEVNGLAVPCSDPDALVTSAVRLATDPRLRNRLRARAREGLLGQSWERVTTQFETDLKEVVQAHAIQSRSSRVIPVAESAA